jgi:cyclopropane fatty-acyl-phospholipid synthase-like methyltransferase
MDWATRAIVTEALKGKTFTKAVDMACGWGDYGDILKQHCLHLIGVDRSPIRLRMAKQSGYDEVIQAQMQDYTPPSDTDAVFFFNAIEHMPLEQGFNLLQKVKEIPYIMLTTDTKFFPSTTNHHALWSEKTLHKFGFRTVLFNRGLLPNLLYGQEILAVRVLVNDSHHRI